MLTKVTSLNTEFPWSVWRFPWLPSSRFGNLRKGIGWFHPGYVGESKTILENLRITMLQVSNHLELWHVWSCNSQFSQLLASGIRFGSFLDWNVKSQTGGTLDSWHCLDVSECLSGLVCSCFDCSKIRRPLPKGGARLGVWRTSGWAIQGREPSEGQKSRRLERSQQRNGRALCSRRSESWRVAAVCQLESLARYSAVSQAVCKSYLVAIETLLCWLF